MGSEYGRSKLKKYGEGGKIYCKNILSNYGRDFKSNYRKIY